MHVAPPSCISKRTELLPSQLPRGLSSSGSVAAVRVDPRAGRVTGEQIQCSGFESRALTVATKRFDGRPIDRTSKGKAAMDYVYSCVRGPDRDEAGDEWATPEPEAVAWDRVCQLRGWRLARDIPPIERMLSDDLAVWASYCLANSSRPLQSTYDAERDRALEELVRRVTHPLAIGDCAGMASSSSCARGCNG